MSPAILKLHNTIEWGLVLNLLKSHLSIWLQCVEIIQFNTQKILWRPNFDWYDQYQTRFGVNQVSRKMKLPIRCEFFVNEFFNLDVY